MNKSQFRLYPTTKLTIKPIIKPTKYSIPDNESDDYNEFYKSNSINKDCEISALEDIYAEDERKTVLEFRWDKPGYIRQYKLIGNVYREPREYDNDDDSEPDNRYCQHIEDIEYYDYDIDSSICESPASSSLINITDCISDVYTNIEEPLLDYHTPPYEETAESEESDDLDIVALADAIDELTAAIDEQHTSDDETEINPILLLEY